MAQVTIRINGYAYTVGCEDGQEAHLQAMGRSIDRYVDRVKALGKQSGESQILVLASLLMADEMHDLAIARDTAPELATRPVSVSPVPATPGLEEALHELAERAEDIAALLERD